MIVIVAICDRISLLPHFLSYYSRIGGTRFIVALYNGDKNPLYKEVEAFNRYYDLHIRPSIICPWEEFNGPREARGLNLIREEFSPKDGWYCAADLDEFVYREGKTLPEIVAEAESAGYEAVHGEFLDRISSTGKLVPVGDLLDECFPLCCNLSRHGGVTMSKIPLARSHLEIWSGRHRVGTKMCWYNATEIHHFKWTSEIRNVLEVRYKSYVAQRLPWAEESKRFLDVTATGGIDVSDPKFNVRPAALLGV